MLARLALLHRQSRQLLCKTGHCLEPRSGSGSRILIPEPDPETGRIHVNCNRFRRALDLVACPIHCIMNS
jgi:hypothetical protein